MGFCWQGQRCITELMKRVRGQRLYMRVSLCTEGSQ